jgi:polyhydroxybutyrate depolymerase
MKTLEHLKSYVIGLCCASLLLQMMEAESLTFAPSINLTNLRIERSDNSVILNWDGSAKLCSTDKLDTTWKYLTRGNVNEYMTTAKEACKFFVTEYPRPVTLQLPSNYSPDKKYPFIMILHGYGSTSNPTLALKNFVKYEQFLDSKQFILCYAIGTQDAAGRHFWNASDACCDYTNTGVDDSRYLRTIIDDVIAKYDVDPKRVFIQGFSNGAYMAYRMACEHADVIAAVVCQYGMMHNDPSLYKPAEPVNILHIHGDSDTVVYFEGGISNGNGIEYPSAHRSLEMWADYNGCNTWIEGTTKTLDLAQSQGGLDTIVSYYENYPLGGEIVLWKVVGMGHGDFPSSSYTKLVVDWMLSHPKP